jgi:periplasmic protein TonB
MTSQEILRADMLDILFENRYKRYGAYELRRWYPARLSLALFSSLSVVGLLLLFFSPQYKNISAVVLAPGDSAIVLRTQILLPQTPPPPPPRNIHPAATPAQVQDVTIRITEEIDMTDVPEQGALVDRVTGGATSDGDPAALPQIPVPVVDEQGTPARPESFIPSYTAPEFPGGLSAWLHFLNRNLRVPASLAPGEKRSVMVRFLVGADGAVSDFEMVQSAGAEFDAEVIRVLKKMPKWKPAVQNGNPVALAFTQPVTFIGAEE